MKELSSVLPFQVVLSAHTKTRETYRELYAIEHATMRYLQCGELNPTSYRGCMYIEVSYEQDFHHFDQQQAFILKYSETRVRKPHRTIINRMEIGNDMSPSDRK